MAGIVAGNLYRTARKLWTLEQIAAEQCRADGESPVYDLKYMYHLIVGG